MYPQQTRAHPARWLLISIFLFHRSRVCSLTVSTSVHSVLWERVYDRRNVLLSTRDLNTSGSNQINQNRSRDSWPVWYVFQYYFMETDISLRIMGLTVRPTCPTRPRYFQRVVVPSLGLNPFHVKKLDLWCETVSTSAENMLSSSLNTPSQIMTWRSWMNSPIVRIFNPLHVLGNKISVSDIDVLKIFKFYEQLKSS